MKHKAFSLLVLLAMLLGMTACGEKPTPTPIPVTTVDLAEITLVPYTSKDLSISGVVPAGWTEASPGIFARASSAVDMAVLLLDVVPMSAEDFLDIVTEQYGLEERPESTGAREANDLTWSLYIFEVQGVSRDLALAESEGLTLIVILRSAPNERDVLYEAVFLPAVEAMAPIE